VTQVRFYLDDMSKVYTTETSAPWDFLGGRPWNTVGKIDDGKHRIVAALSFSDGTSGYVDSIFNIRNGNQVPVARATQTRNLAFVQTVNSTSTTVVTENQTIPWALFGSTCAVIIVLSIVLGGMRKKKAQEEKV